MIFTNKKISKQEKCAKWQYALKNSGIGMWDWDAKSNTVFYSEESKNILGFKSHEIASSSKEWDDRVHPEDRAKYFEDFNNHISGINPDYYNEHRVLTKNNTYKWILDKGKVIERDRNGKPLRIIGTHTDITERKEFESNLTNSLNIITKQNNKLQNFAYIVSHNLKQHAGNFESILEFHDEANTEIEKKELITHLKTVSKSLTKTIKNLNQVVSIENKKTLKIEKLFLAIEVNSILDSLELIIKGANADIRNTIDPSIYINYDASYLESIIQNLLTNAIKYKHPDRKPLITISLENKKENLVLKISDNGIGIDLDKYGDSVFGLYKTFHQNPEAEGVGLYLVKNQIEAFGGMIDVTSQINVGTTFIITIPNKKIQQ
ncbi:PAS domain-containing protein [Olleya sp. R77988]|uniref:PAS domain-containing protein n=1 Tax=Olleya sp. R77988 TaxID=3093875 RepID=UPI0037CC84C1